MLVEVAGLIAGTWSGLASRLVTSGPGTIELLVMVTKLFIFEAWPSLRDLVTAILGLRA